MYFIWWFPEIGVPPVIIHMSGIFPNKNQPAFLGTPMAMETPLDGPESDWLCQATHVAGVSSNQEFGVQLRGPCCWLWLHWLAGGALTISVTSEERNLRRFVFGIITISIYY